MERKIRVVQYGCGKMAKFLMRYVIEHGGEIVGAYDANPVVVGKDIGEIMEVDNCNVIIKDAKDFDSDLKILKPDVCIVATMSTIKDIYESFKICAENGVNAISTCEEALYPWNSSPKLTEELDKLAKENNCTLSGSGYPDMYWGTLIVTLAGSLHKISKINGSSSYNVEDYGIALAEGHGAGLTVEEFNKEVGLYNEYSYEEISKIIERGEYIPSYMWNQNGWLCEKLGLTIISQTQRCEPHIAPKDIYSSTLDMTIKKGDCLGMSAIVTTTTEEGITFETECIGKVYEEGEVDKNIWSFEGEPATSIVVSEPATVELTCATLVNSIPKLIDAEPGYITTNHMRNNDYMIKPMNEYVETK
ncbi:dihydrodipicolinate reductase [Anaerosphaera multitolerans]|uniref:Dihydrodipicolinate reductase n=1 Tax=Anaerosphaera multitolerans TaxID=2487351 RepID=A0A437S6J8_9FIRM|nr:dihydrodipicolinate reductase [Anaerosphaera multitolerans]RVU54620.1 dihydrodipicolinate reductase [Anaerosphaera multitolerans]